MTGSAKTGGEAGKAKGRKTPNAKPRASSAAVSIARSSDVDLGKQLDLSRRELAEARRQLSEALDQQTATSEVLKVISNSPTDIQPVLDAVGENAARLCDANNAVIFRLEGNLLRQVASYGGIPTTSHPTQGLPVNRGRVTGRAVFERRTIHVHDLAAEDSDFPEGSRDARRDGHRTTLATPLLRDGVPIGAILIRRMEVRPFSQKQIDLLATFAAQAVIAIENTRLLNELRESLQQQTATADVLKVISRSTFDLKTVLNTLAESATRLCDADATNIWRPQEGRYLLAATYGLPPEYKARLENVSLKPNGRSVVGRTLLARQTLHVPDMTLDPEYAAYDRERLGGYRAMLGVPLMREGLPVGVMMVGRTSPRPFTEAQIALVTTFADQAVIAIENVRLFEAEQQRTQELSEALEQQTATSEVLKVISSSPGELEPVFNAMLTSAVQICGAKFGNLWLVEGAHFRIGATHGAPPAYAEYLTREPLIRPLPGTAIGRVATTRQVVQIADVRLEDAYAGRDPVQIGTLELAGARTVIAVPMLKEDELIGTIIIYRDEVRPFTDKQIELVKNFAAQAVVAIENARLLSELRLRTNDLTESLEQQTATSEVLEVISGSTGDLQPVFGAMLNNAVRLCEASFGALLLYEGDEAYRVAALHNAPPAYVEVQRHKPVARVGSLTPHGRAGAARKVLHIADLTEDIAYKQGDRLTVWFVEETGARTLVLVPMLKDDDLVGIIVIYRQEVHPFTDKQIELVGSFARQAVIAIENTRLLSELRESLQQKTATADVLKVISRSTFDLQTVLDALVESAVRLCGAESAHIFRRTEETYELAACRGYSREYEEFMRHYSLKAGRESIVGRIALEGRVVHIPDVMADPEYNQPKAQSLGRWRTMLGVPLLREGKPVGALTLTRSEVRPFTDNQIELLTTFADQAVIAIENVRLFEAEQTRTRELTESLEQQTATSEVLKIVSSSPGELEPVFNAMLDNAIRICSARFGLVFTCVNGVISPMAFRNVPAELVDFLSKRGPVAPNSGTTMHRLLETKQIVHVEDLAKSDGLTSPTARLGGARSYIGIPMLKDDEVIGSFNIYRQEVRPFTDKQIELVQNFAAQAVIAIENARLLNELRQRTGDLSEALEQQTATSEVLKVISSSPGELEPAFNAMLENATRICEAKFGFLWLYDGQRFRLGAVGQLVEAEFARFARENPPNLDRQSLAGRAVLEKRTVHIHDVLEDREYKWQGDEGTRVGNFRTVLGVPLMREGASLGAFSLARTEVRPFTDKQIELVTNFAAQAVIAIENARLLNELRQRTDDLSKSLEDLQTAQDRLVQTQKLASLGQLTAGIAHEIKNPLNFVNNFSSLSTELLDELREALQSLPIDGKARSEIDELTETLRANLDKIEQHGKRADSIVKNMLMHSREGSGEHRPIDINSVVEESLNLAYHGARAEKQDFNITLERSFDPAAGEVDVFPQEITRVLLNLIANGFYAATKRKAQADSDAYEPALTASTRSLGDRVEITIRDNGTGIPAEVKEKMFNPFFTTKPPGEGTGLGLSLSYDIVVKQHAGLIEVETEPGAFTEFKIILPRAAATIAKTGGRA